MRYAAGSKVFERYVLSEIPARGSTHHPTFFYKYTLLIFFFLKDINPPDWPGALSPNSVPDSGLQRQQNPKIYFKSYFFAFGVKKIGSKECHHLKMIEH